MSVIVRTGPQEYECSQGVLNTLPERLEARGIQKIALVHGQKSWIQAKPYLKKMKAATVDVQLIQFSGECSYEEVSRLKVKVKHSQVDAVIGIGGGKLMDAVKHAAASFTDLRLILIPTLASNCAPWTPISVMYTEAGVCIGFDVHPTQTDILLVEPQLLLTAPENYFVAGLADTLAKWYESDLTLSSPENRNQPFLRLARSAAYECRETILCQAQAGVEAIKTCQLTPAFIQLVDTIISLSGLVGGLGDKYARTTIGHAVHDKLTVFPQTHAFLHGEKVGYGILVQLAVEEKWEEIDKLIDLYRRLNLPVSLKELNLGALDESEIEAFVSLVSEDTILKASGYPVSRGKLLKAVLSLEANREEDIYSKVGKG